MNSMPIRTVAMKEAKNKYSLLEKNLPHSLALELPSEKIEINFKSISKKHTLSKLEMEDNLQNSFCLLIGFKGDWKGFAFISAQYPQINNLPWKEDLLIETGNIIMGKLLTNLCEKEIILCDLMAPVVFKSLEGTALTDFHRKKKLLNILESFTGLETPKVTYTFNWQETLVPFYIHFLYQS